MNGCVPTDALTPGKCGQVARRSRPRATTASAPLVAAGLHWRTRIRLYRAADLDRRSSTTSETLAEALSTTPIEVASGSTVQRIMRSVFVAIALLMLLAAVWLAILFAVAPDRADQRPDAPRRRARRRRPRRACEGEPDDELGPLSRAFNRMTRQIEQQRGELVDANRQLDTRRRFTEAVLAGVSAGVIGLDDQARINRRTAPPPICWRSSSSTRIGQPIAVMPGDGAAGGAGAAAPDRVTQGQINLERGAETRILLVRIIAEFIASRSASSSPSTT